MRAQPFVAVVLLFALGGCPLALSDFSIVNGDGGDDASADASIDRGEVAEAGTDTQAHDTGTFDTGSPDTAPDSGGILVFDSIPMSSGVSTHGAGDSCGTAISVTTTQSISQISVKNTLTVPTNIKFMIWNKGTSTLLYISTPKNFTSAGDTWKDSDPLTFTLQAGTQYYVGGIADTGGTWDYDTTIDTQNGISSLIMDPTWTNYTSPALGAPGGADCGIRLYR